VRRRKLASAPGKPRVDGLLLVAAGDPDVARLGGFADRDGQGEHARGVVSRDPVGVEGLAEEDLPGVGPIGPFGDQQLGAVGLGRGAFGADGEHVLLDSQADRVRVDAGQVEVDEELVGQVVMVLKAFPSMRSGPVSLTRQRSRPAWILIVSSPPPAPWRTALAANSWTAITTSAAR
jgi:hypothetical protein